MLAEAHPRLPTPQTSIAVKFRGSRLPICLGIKRSTLLADPGASRPGRTRSAVPRSRQCPGAGQHRRQDNDPGCVCAGGRRLHRRRRCVAHRGDGLHPGRHGKSAIHPGQLSAQRPVGPCAPAGPGEPGAAGTGLGRRGGIRRRAARREGRPEPPT